MSANQTGIVLGRVRAAHGTGGVVKVESFTEPPEGLARYENLRCVALQNSVFKGFVRFDSLRRCNGGKKSGGGGNVFLAKIQGCDRREQAEALQGAKFCLDKEDLPPLDDGTFYHHTLTGKKVLDEQGRLLGEVTAVRNFGAGDLLEVLAAQKSSEESPKESTNESTNDKTDESLLLPFAEDSITLLDDGNLEVHGFYAQLLTERAS